MIMSIMRRLKARRLRREIREQQEAFAGEPLMMHLAAMIQYASPEQQEELVGYFAEGVSGALIEMGCLGPWGGEKRALAAKACKRLLGGALPGEFVQAVMQRVEDDATAGGSPQVLQ